jgi:hypothetical protein
MSNGKLVAPGDIREQGHGKEHKVRHAGKQRTRDLERVHDGLIHGVSTIRAYGSASLTVVPDVMVRSLAVLNTLRARNKPM